MEEEMATHSSTLAWKIPWMEEPGRLPSMGLHRVGHDWSGLAAAAAAAAEPKDHDNGYRWRWSGLSQWPVEVLNLIDCYFGFPHSSVGKELLQCRRPGFNPWAGKIPWRRERLPTPVFWPGEFPGLYIVHGVGKSWTRLSGFHLTY